MRTPLIILATVAFLFVILSSALPGLGEGLAQEATPQRSADPWTKSSGDSTWDDIREWIQALSPVVIALAAGIPGALGVRRYFEQRRRQTDLDVAKLQGDLVTLLRTISDGSDDPDHKEELDKAQDVYEATLRGLILKNPELMTAARRSLQKYLEVGIASQREKDS